MAIESLEIDVIINVAEALSSLEELENELDELSDDIDAVDRRGTEGISVNTRVDPIDDDLAEIRAKLAAFERSTSLDIGTNIGGIGGGGGGMGPAQLRGVMRDAMADALSSTGGSQAVDASARSRTLRGALQRMQASTASNVGELFDQFDDFGGTRRGTGDDGGPLDSLFRRMRGSFSSMIDGMGEFDLRMSDLHNAMARLVPLLLVFIGAIPAAYTALIGLATAAVAAAASLAAIGGFGALGVALQDGQLDMARLQEVGTEIKNSFIDAFAPLAEQLQPLFIDAVDGLDRFFQLVANNGDALLELRDEARAFGQFVIDFVPNALRAIAGLVEGMADVFGNIGDFLQRNFAGGMRQLLRVTRDAIPAVAEVGLLLAQAVPTLVEMSVGFMRVVGTVIQVIGAFSRLLGLLGIGPEMFGLLTGAILAAATATLLFRTAIVKALIASLAKLGGGILAAASSLVGYSGSAIVATLATNALGMALLTLIGIVTLGLGIAVLAGVVGGIASQFDLLKNDITDTTDALKEFDNVASSVGGNGSQNPYGFTPENGSGGGSGTSGSNSSKDVTINIESSGDSQEDRSNARYAAWAQGRDTGST